MLEFFRKYQWYFFLVITIVTIISFSFFGTYSTLGSNTWREQIAFKAVNGKEVTRADVDEMAVFLATDNEDKLLYGGAWGPNFLNDGVIRKDFLETGLAQELVTAYQTELQSDLQKKLDKEKKYTLYTHPQARFLSVQNTWAYFIPEMNAYFQSLRSAQQATNPVAFDARVKLYLAQKKFPAPALQQVLRYQERQYNWLTHDQALDQTDFSLFGYHNVEEWFTPQFTRLISQFIINASILAEQKGYSVSNAEVLADLIRHTDTSYQQTKDKPYIGVASPEEYFNEQLRQLHMDQSRAIKTWRQVMLFRRYFQDVGQAALVDATTYQKLNDFSQETLALDVYQLPKALQFNDYKTLEQFENYLKAVAKPVKEENLTLPTEFLTVSEVSKNYPELIQNRYLLEVSQVNKKKLQNKVGLRETWAWEVADSNWDTLKKQFPDIGVKKAETREERFAVLEALDAITRARIDNFARSMIVDSHPEWLEKAFEDTKPISQVVSFRIQGGKSFIEGLDSKEQRQALMKTLDQAQLGEQPLADSPLYAFTADQQNYYRIKVIEKATQPEILTFAEARQDGTLDSLKAGVDEAYMDKIVKAIQDQKGVKNKNLDKPLTKDQAASLRFYTYMRQVKDQLEKDPTQGSSFTQSKSHKEATVSLKDRQPLVDQWLIEQKSYHLNRGNQEELVDAQEAFNLPIEKWSAIRSPANGDLSFFQVREKGAAPEKESAIADQVKKAYALLSAEAQRVLMKQVLEEIVAKNAISLAYLKQPSEEPSSSQESINSEF